MRKIQIKKTGYGHWRIATEIRGCECSTITTDSISIDNYLSDMNDREKGAMGQTKKQAAESLYYEIKKANP